MQEIFHVLMILLDLILDPKAGYPLWLVISLALLAGVGFFWEKIKSSIELRLQRKGNIEEKQTDHELLLKLKKYEEEKVIREQKREQAFNEEQEKDLEIKGLAARLRIVEDENTRLKQSNTALSMAILFMIDKYEKDHPDDKTVIERVKKIIEDNMPKNGVGE